VQVSILFDVFPSRSVVAVIPFNRYFILDSDKHFFRDSPDILKCCGFGMFYPGSGSLIFSSGIRIPDPGGKKAPDPGFYCT
jgi:hypothetical protein